MSHVEKLRDNVHERLDRALQPVAILLSRLGVLPNHVTIAGAVMNLVTAGLIVAGLLRWAAVLWLVAGALDLLDGALARSQDKATAFGAFLDSTFDRISEGILFSAIAYHFAVLGQPVDAALAVLALLGSILVSYTRARSEALGVRCKVGVLTRAERVVLLALGLWIGVLEEVIYLVVVLTAYTVVQRVLHTFRELGTQN
ncbi:MAG: CDP-alcohol phosphatidyltransferase family protein [Alphaproteobacteria bacterium]